VIPARLTRLTADAYYVGSDMLTTLFVLALRPPVTREPDIADSCRPDWIGSSDYVVYALLQTQNELSSLNRGVHVENLCDAPPPTAAKMSGPERRSAPQGAPPPLSTNPFWTTALMYSYYEQLESSEQSFK
jgi:hypothetical protein